MEILIHSSEWLVVVSNLGLAHVTIKTVQAMQHDFHYIHAPKVWRTVNCKLRPRPAVKA